MDRNWIEELSDSVKLALFDRISNPFLTAFIISWLIVNYEIVLVIFSGEAFAYKTTWISEYFEGSSSLFFFGETSNWVIKGFLHPLYGSVIYTFIIPLVCLPGYAFTKLMHLLYRNVRNYFEGITPLEPEKAKALKNSNLDLRMEIDEKNTTIADMSGRIRNLDSEIEAKNEEIEKLQSNKPNISVAGKRNVVLKKSPPSKHENEPELIDKKSDKPAEKSEQDNKADEKEIALKKIEFDSFTVGDVDRLLNEIYEKGDYESSDVANFLKKPKIKTDKLVEYLMHDNLLDIGFAGAYELTEKGEKRLSNSHIFK